MLWLKHVKFSFVKFVPNEDIKSGVECVGGALVIFTKSLPLVELEFSFPSSSLLAVKVSF